MSDFFKFVEDNEKDFTTAQEFVATLYQANTNKESLKQWFATKGYDVSLQECLGLIIRKIISKQALIL